MNTPDESPKTNVTLEMILRQKVAKQAEIRESRQRINDMTRQIFHPVQETATGANALMNNFQSGMAIFNGVMTGFKIIKRIRAFFQRKK